MIYSSIRERFRGSAASNASKPAIHSPVGSLSYEELFRATDDLVDHLKRMGIQGGEVSALQLSNTPSFLVSFFALLSLRVTIVPLDMSLKKTEILKINALLPFDLVVCSEGSLFSTESTFRTGIFSHLLKIQLDPRGTELRPVSEDFALHQNPLRPRGLSFERSAVIQFSSGSTGEPKGILLTEESIYARSFPIQETLQMNEDDRTLCSVPLSHSHGIDCLALPTLLCGGTLYLRNPQTTIPSSIFDQIERDKITFFSSIPAFYDLAVRMDLPRSYDLSSLRYLFCGSAALAPQTAVSVFEKFGISLNQGYGLAEIGVITMNTDRSNDKSVLSVGTPIRGMETKILESGELCARSPGLFSGYLHELESETSPRSRDQWLHSEDLVQKDERNQLFIVGRLNDQIRVSALAVFPVEIERAILQFSDVKDVVVYGEPDEISGERVVAAWSSHSELSSAQTKAAEAHFSEKLRELLSDHKIPKRWVWLKELPKSPLGKVLRARLKGMAH